MFRDVAEQRARRSPQMAVAALQRVMTARARRQTFLMRDPDQRVAAYQFREAWFSVKNRVFADAAEMRIHSNKP